jgi:hypothetical protein
MTDRERLEALLTSWHVEFRYEAPNRIRVDGGYAGFHTLFMFDADGRFTQMGAYE